MQRPKSALEKTNTPPNHAFLLRLRKPIVQKVGPSWIFRATYSEFISFLAYFHTWGRIASFRSRKARILKSFDEYRFATQNDGSVRLAEEEVHIWTYPDLAQFFDAVEVLQKVSLQLPIYR